MSMRMWSPLGSLAFCRNVLTVSSLFAWTAASVVGAQPPRASLPATEVAASPNAPLLQRLYLNKNVIELPIEINAQDRSQIREIQLYVKQLPLFAWTLRDKAGPDQKAFLFQAPRDGEYGFTMMIVDKQDRTYPNDIRDEPPAVVVVIDTKPPSITLTNLGTCPEGQLVHCEVRDTNINGAKTQFYFQGGDKFFRPLDPVPGRPNVYCVPSQAVFTGVVRGSVEDLAGNQAVCENHITQLPMPHAVVAINQPSKAIKTPQVVMPATAGKSPQTPLIESVVHAVLPTASNQRQINRSAVELLPAAATESSRHSTNREESDETPRSDLQPVAKRSPTNDAPFDLPVPPPSDKRLATDNETSKSANPRLLPQEVTQAAPRKESPKRQLVSQSKVYIDFQIENVDPSGVGKVETWITRNDGQRWVKLCEDIKGKSPVAVQLPGDGVYGVTLVATNGRGVGGTPPSSGDNPDLHIEVDTTKPSAKITQSQAFLENGVPTVKIAWTVSDENLGERPVELYCSANAQGPWMPIAKRLESNGQYRWTSASGVGPQAYLRLVARDLAGNESIAYLTEPIHFSDQMKLRAVIRGVRTDSATPSPVNLTGN